MLLEKNKPTYLNDGNKAGETPCHMPDCMSATGKVPNGTPEVDIHG